MSWFLSLPDVAHMESKSRRSSVAFASLSPSESVAKIDLAYSSWCAGKGGGSEGRSRPTFFTTQYSGVPAPKISTAAPKPSLSPLKRDTATFRVIATSLIVVPPVDPTLEYVQPLPSLNRNFLCFPLIASDYRQRSCVPSRPTEVATDLAKRCGFQFSPSVTIWGGKARAALTEVIRRSIRSSTCVKVASISSRKCSGKPRSEPSPQP